MTTPPVKIPYLPQGNTLTDISQAAASLASGLNAEKAKRREDAMAEALLRLKEQQLMEPDWVHETVQIPTDPQRPGSGGLFHAYRNKKTLELRITPDRAPESQYFFPAQDAQGNLTVGGAGRYTPGSPAVEVPMPQGVRPRPEPPRTVTVETPGGPRTGQFDPRRGTVSPVRAGPEGFEGIAPGAEIAPKADEADERRARDAFEMVQGLYEMTNVTKRAPRAYDEAAKYIAAMNIGEGIPLVGGFVEALIRQGQSALTPEAAQYFNAFMQFASARAFSRGGATLTKNEIDYSLASLSPKPYENPQTYAARQRAIQTVIGAAIAGNNAWRRYSTAAKALGYEYNLDVQAPAPPRANRYGIVKPQ